jgi:hypothetical protein
MRATITDAPPYRAINSARLAIRNANLMSGTGSLIDSACLQFHFSAPIVVALDAGVEHK